MDIHLDNAVGYAPYPGVQSNGNPTRVQLKAAERVRRTFKRRLQEA